MAKVNLTREDANEVMHKLGILSDNQDSQEEYGLTKEQCDGLVSLIPAAGGEFDVPSWAEKAVKEEMQDHCLVLDDISADARNSNERGQALRISKQARRLERLFGI